MWVSLYDAKAGYYGAGKASVGRAGDYFTSVSVGSLFGQLLAHQAVEVWERLGRPSVFRIIEQGGHDARLARDLLDAVDAQFSDFANCVRYTVCDPYPFRSNHLDPRIDFCDSVEDVGEGSAALFLCNELLDAFPVHRIRFRSDGWKELWVRLEEGGDLAMEERPPSPELEQAIAIRIPSGAYPDGYTTELCLEIAPWIRSAAATLDKGMLLIVDYGLFADDYYAPGRTDGTLRCFSGHQADDDPLVTPGERDITAHVDWTAVMKAGESAGLSRIGFSDQGAYLTRLAAPLLQKTEAERKAGMDRKWIRQFQTLTHPGIMGRSFGVIAFAKGVDTSGWTGFSALKMNCEKLP
ncbi:MAG: SAM-dependent methyltransferase [Verrucomicrobia bacterium]|nr:SAM-dependent methyltransferase [Verrucomicrobiota bacterium]